MSKKNSTRPTVESSFGKKSSQTNRPTVSSSSGQKSPQSSQPTSQQDTNLVQISLESFESNTLMYKNQNKK